MFPAPAGINRNGARFSGNGCGVPRASGDKPPYLLYQLGSARVFPAPAGINRVRKTVYAASLSVPRASGDKP
ncbi:hypothetical protein IM977_001545 [Salmonella enterica subsp. enterica serovar Typhimurium]|nr:hypothetical protein [Salmonella enterica subsp. enterica serovar Typhimurium]